MVSTFAKALARGNRKANALLAIFAERVRLAIVRSGEDTPVTAELVSAAIADIDEETRQVFGARNGDLGELGALILAETALTTEMATVEAMAPIDRAMQSDPLLNLFMNRLASDA